ncbi:hypothetical protein AgCh_030760 [Apium graveolens]
MQVWRLTCFYGEPNRNLRRRTWDLLRNLARDSNLPWCIIGDMNNIISQLDKRGGAAYPQKLIDGFNDVLEVIGLQDLDLTGHQFTWERGRNTANWLEIRLDRAIVTGDWLYLFPMAKLYNLKGSPSDHSPIFLEPKSWGEDIESIITQKVKQCGEKLEDYYEGLFRSAQGNVEEVVNTVTKKITTEQNMDLMKEISEEEVKSALFQMHPDKAPGPDGMTPAFFQKHWKVVGKDVVKMVSDFFYIGELPQGLNETNIVLIPKKKNPSIVEEFRPIALCNVLIKIVTKVLANRMKGLLDVVISDTQSAFVPGRLISDNIIISYEVIHYLKRKKTGKEGFMALKLDMSKAYDRIEWNFLEAMLKKMEGLSSLTRAYEEKQWIHGVKADRADTTKMMELLNVYERASGQKLNRGKSSVFFSSNVLEYNRQAICQILQMGEVGVNSTYLGLPNLLGRNKTTILGYLKDKARSQVNSWNGHFISRSGKEVLIRTVAQALPTYAMNVFLLPMEITKHIERTLSNYWWRQNQASNSKLNWMSWERLSRHKSSGGMGFRDFRSFNLAMLGKQGWRLMSNTQSLVTKMYKARYFANSDFLNSELGHNPSFIWRSIWEARKLVAEGSRWEIGTGDNIKIMGQPWLSDSSNPYITTDSQVLHDNKVSSLMQLNSREWDHDVIKDGFNERDQKLILDIRLDSSVIEDPIYWMHDVTGAYTVKSAYKLLQYRKGAWCDEDKSSIWAKVWRIKAPPRTVEVVWRALSNCLPTLVQLCSKRVQVQCLCPVCHEENETIMHRLITCPFAQQCWLLIKVDIWKFMATDFGTWLANALMAANSKMQAEILTLCWSFWNQKSVSVNKTVATAKQYLLQWSQAQSRISVASLQPTNEGDGAVIWVNPQPNSIKAKAILHEFLLNPTLAEAMAVKEALSWIDEVQWNNVSVVSDCLVVIQAIRSKTTLRSRFWKIIEECREYLRRLNKVYLFHVKRSANMVAHQLAKKSYIYPGRTFDGDLSLFQSKIVLS